MAPTNKSSSGSSKKTSSSSRKTKQTSASSVQSSATRRRQAQRDVFLASEIETMGISSPKQGPMTRSMKREHPELELLEELESDLPVRKSPKKRKTTDPDPTEGSPWDATVRTKLNVNDLDLNKSYVGTLTRTPVRKPERPPRQPRWRHDGDQPLIDIKGLPKGWNTREPDLDPNDIDAQIERCKERIEDNIMPHTFETRLREYEERKAEREQMARGEPSGLDWNVIQRIDYLKKMKEEFEKNGDDKGQIPNLEALLKAYRTRKLQWTGLVTYWSKGQQLCQPRPFNWDEFEAINRKFDGHKGFWVEGYLGPGPELHYVGITFEVGEIVRYLHNIRAAVRLPGYEWWEEFDFLHDTGASLMSLFEADIATLMGPFRPPMYPEVPILGSTRIQTANGIITKETIEVEVTMLDSRNRRMCQWLRVPCVLKERGSTTTRVDGPWIRHVLWNAYAPDGNQRFYVANSKGSLNLPGRCPARKTLNTIVNPEHFQAPPETTTLRPGPPRTELIYAGAKAMPPPARGAPK